MKPQPALTSILGAKSLSCPFLSCHNFQLSSDSLCNYVSYTVWKK